MCQEKFNVTIHNKNLLLQAFSHSSYVNEQKRKLLSNERLEFLGDAVLDLIVVSYLYENFPQYDEGLLTRMKANLVCETTLVKLAESLDIGSCLLLNKGEERDGGRQKNTLLADAMEALLGVLYLDQGLELTKKFVVNLYKPHFKHIVDSLLNKDAKSYLNEFRQKEGKTLPVYKILREWGEDHAKQYEIGVFFDENFIASGIGANKKEAAQLAAQLAYRKAISVI